MAAPVLSTPDDRILDHQAPPSNPTPHQQYSDDEFATIYEIDRTVRELAEGGWQRIALQFPDEHLPDASRIVETLQVGLRAPRGSRRPAPKTESLETDLTHLSVSHSPRPPNADAGTPRLYILGDTSYGACCVDTISAAHIPADAIVHYGRACLTPLAPEAPPIVYVFTRQPLDHGPLLAAFRTTYADRGEKVALVADAPYAWHVPVLAEKLRDEGYENVFATEIQRAPESALPNRTVPEGVQQEPEQLQEWRLFHIAEPPPALLLTVASRVRDIRVYPTSPIARSPGAPQPPSSSLPDPTAATRLLLRRRYALVTRLSRAATIGILVRSLALSSLLPAIAALRARLAAAGRAAYVVVVGQPNPAKLANFAEVEAWVAVGCWESSLIEADGEGTGGGGGGGGYWKPVGTPWEMEMALRGDGERVWTGAWVGGLEGLREERKSESDTANGDADDWTEKVEQDVEAEDGQEEREIGNGGELDDLDESEPPEFDLRTGRYVSRPPVMPRASTNAKSRGDQKALQKRARGDEAIVGNQYSAGAEFLRAQRTWQGLGSDFEVAYDESTSGDRLTVEEGRSGIARGYANEAGRT